MNGDFKYSPLLETIRRLHQVFTEIKLSYAVIGGMAVIKNGAKRTTQDIDILTTHEGWEKITAANLPGFHWKTDSAQDSRNEVTIDVLFTGDDRDLIFPLPHPQDVAEYDAELGAYFADLIHILELKLAVYQQKKREEGIELTAKNLGDAVELVKYNLNKINDDFIAKLHPALQKDCRQILKKVRKLHKKKPR